MRRRFGLQAALVHLLQYGSVALPTIWFTEYKKLRLSEKEVMLLLHLWVFQEKEGVLFPTYQQFAERMNGSVKEIRGLLEELVRKDFIDIEVYEEHGVRAERYSLAPFWQKLADVYMQENHTSLLTDEQRYARLFQMIEFEFGRPLSPSECEYLTRWIDEDGYSDELIEAALREAVYGEKFSVRYMDRVLLDWQQHGIKTAEEAVRYARKFRRRGSLYDQPRKTVPTFSFYNWVHKYESQ